MATSDGAIIEQNEVAQHSFSPASIFFYVNVVFETLFPTFHCKSILSTFLFLFLSPTHPSLNSKLLYITEIFFLLFLFNSCHFFFPFSKCPPLCLSFFLFLFSFSPNLPLSHFQFVSRDEPDILATPNSYHHYTMYFVWLGRSW